MALFLVPTPIGNSQDFTLRALDILKSADLIIVEEFKESSKQLRSVGIQNKPLDQLNEHSTPSDFLHLLEECRLKKVALISDSGTPGFCDPGNDLVKLCRKNHIPVQALPGPSSLMTLLSLTGIRMPQFLFKGFLSPETNTRQKELQKLRHCEIPIVLMDTPYRLKKLLSEIEQVFPHNLLLLGANLTQENEFVCEAPASVILKKLPYPKAEFILILYPKETASFTPVTL
jgi:16S rRNA (cytidine1402-2'-O)-methyltransferase